MSTDQERFDASVRHYCEGYTVAPGCAGERCEHAEGDPEHYCEPSFSWTQCDSCGSTFGGDRHPAFMIPLEFKAGDDTIIDASICSDCVQAWANAEDPEQWHRTPAEARAAEEARHEIH